MLESQLVGVLGKIRKCGFVEGGVSPAVSFEDSKGQAISSQLFLPPACESKHKLLAIDPVCKLQSPRHGNHGLIL